MLYLEGIVLFLIVGLQLYFFYKSKGEISYLHTFFPDNALNSDCVKTVTNFDHSVELLDIPHSNKEFNKVIFSTNAYLRKNKGSADFNIVKSIADRCVEAQENKVAATLSLPLYLGLMGTFIGVILGLGSIAIDGFDIANTDTMIKQLITGVVLSMIVSLFGLALTTILNAFLFRNAVADRDINRNLYFNFLQVELLPTLNNNLYSALDQLKSNIADFNSTFSENLDFFDSSFNENISNLKGTVTGMSDQIKAVNENTVVQLEFLAELRKIGYNKMAEANIKVFDKMKEAGPMLVKFIKEQQKLSENLEQANLFGEKISGLMDRISNFEAGINHLGRDLQQSDLLGSDMLSLVAKHLDAIGRREAIVQDYASRATNEVENYFANGLERITVLKNKIEAAFENAFNFEAEGNLLQNLKHLKLIDENTAKLNTQLSAQSDKGIESRLDDMNSLIRVLIAREENKSLQKPRFDALNVKKLNVEPPKKWYHFIKRKDKV